MMLLAQTRRRARHRFIGATRLNPIQSNHRHSGVGLQRALAAASSERPSEFIRNCRHPCQIVLFAARRRFVVECVSDVAAQSEFFVLGKVGFDADFSVNDVIIDSVHLRQDFGCLPDTGAVAQGLMEFLAHPHRGKAGSLAVQFLKYNARTDFRAKVSIGKFEKIITGTGTQCRAIRDVCHSVVQSFHLPKTVPAVGEQPVVLDKSMQQLRRRGRWLSRRFGTAIRRIGFNAQLAVVPLAVSGGGQRGEGRSLLPLVMVSPAAALLVHLTFGLGGGLLV